MFILDIYRFCESRREFTRQDFAKFVYMHRESPRMAKAANVSHRMFASMVSKEFLARSYTNGYLDGKTAWCGVLALITGRLDLTSGRLKGWTTNTCGR